MLELSVQLDEARDANDRLAASGRALEDQITAQERNNIDLQLKVSRLEGMIAAFEMQASMRVEPAGG